MENLQRQQAARFTVEEKLQQQGKNGTFRSLVRSQIHQQAVAFSHYDGALGSTLPAGAGSSTGMTRLHREDKEGNLRPCTGEEMWVTDEQKITDEEESHKDMSNSFQLHEACLSKGATVRFITTDQVSRIESPSAHSHSHQEWTYEEQFKQLYDLDEDEKRKDFLDDLFNFMQKRGTPVNRIPIMAKQVLDLYMLYKLVTEKGGLVEVINKKIWREITKGLHLPTSITSAAFTLRTQYMKYLYPYECEKQRLSSPGELQAAIDSNRRESRRQNFSSTIFSYSVAGPQTSLPTTKIQPHVPMLSHQSNYYTQAPSVKRDDRQESILNLSTNGINSINMSIEINGVVYTGVLFAQQSTVTGIMEQHKKQSNTQGKPGATFFQPSCFSYSTVSLHGQRNSCN
ncbi:AT-rich interactive domain-containing protein 3A-like [Poeciliopsis prolifica]|uniref:AT-rich interactive domain-containing protein 3A-like n=1 Tax=Poeciliopsis prolifica TaxID=188132 RepID=UPI0024141A8A|nr:AT-rich interactive domain-containing protein 3A-like [Poeciliopsis prolifica]